ncbi:MAG: alpha-amylase family glycosyl hydrolase [Bacteroidales bacterium]|nr:alpha-amylase family glycosyl hydrolase [Bacteroidales bacterium]
MRKIFTTMMLFAAALFVANAQAPQNAPDIMLQGFYYDSYNESNAASANGRSYGRTKWTDLKEQAAEIAETFSMVWLPPSAKSEGGTGYHPKQWSNQNGDWGTVSQLKDLISALNTNGGSKNPTGHCYAIADIVINHKSGNGWLDLDNEDFGTYGKFTLYEKGYSSYICSDDEAAGKGYSCRGAKDQGYDTQCNASGGYCAARDLDHSNSTLRSAIKAYLKWMKEEIGYNGWRYDLVKGYLGKYTKEYNNAAGAYYSVGEYWDGSYDALKHWVNETGNTSTVFDFCLKYSSLNEALASNNYAGMAGYGSFTGLAGSSDTRRYATTFVDNHDTFRDHNKFGGDWTKANAYILAGPGIPCVFYPHWVMCKSDIKKMAKARYACGIHSQSSCTTTSTGSYYKCETTGTKGKLICFIGSGWSTPAGYTLACSGNGWAYYTTTQGGQQGGGEQGGEQGGGEQGGSVSGSSFYIRVNGTTDYAATQLAEPDYQGRTQYMASAYVKAGQTVSCFDKDNNAEWTIATLDPYGSYQNFTMSGTGSSAKMTCNVAGCYDFYIKLKFNDDVIYVGEGTNCTSQGEQGGGQGGNQGGNQGGGATPTTGFSILVNGVNYPATAVGEPDAQGRDQYMASAYVEAGQTVSCYDNANAVEWTICTLDPYGSYQSFTMSGTGSSCKLTCNVAGCYDFYIKLAFNDDVIYIGPGTSCSQQGGQQGGEQGGNQGGQQGGGTATDHIWYFKGWINGADVEPSGETRFENGIAEYNFTADSYVFVLYQVHGEPGVQYMAKTYTTGVTHGTLSTSGSEKIMIPAGTKKLYLYDNGDGTVEISTQVMSGKALVDGGQQGGGEQGGEQGGGTQGGGTQGGEQGGGNTTKSITVKVDPASIPWTGDVSVHAWETDGGNLTGEWPGTPMTKDANGWWSYTFNLAGELNVIFTNGLATGTIKTNNIEEINENACYKVLTTTIIDAFGGDAYEFEAVDCLAGGDEVAAEEAKASVTTIYPNPVDEVLNIESQTEFDSAVVTNLAGQTMFFAIDNNTIAVGSLAKGLYIINLVSEDGTVEQGKFIKK